MAVLQHMPALAMATSGVHTVQLHAMPGILMVALAGCVSSILQQLSTAAAYCHLHSDSSRHKLHEDHGPGLARQA